MVYQQLWEWPPRTSDREYHCFLCAKTVFPVSVGIYDHGRQGCQCWPILGSPLLLFYWMAMLSYCLRNIHASTYSLVLLSGLAREASTVGSIRLRIIGRWVPRPNWDIFINSPKAHREEKAERLKESGGWGGGLLDAVLRTWHGHCTHEHSATVATQKRSSQKNWLVGIPGGCTDEAQWVRAREDMKALRGCVSRRVKGQLRGAFDARCIHIWNRKNK